MGNCGITGGESKGRGVATHFQCTLVGGEKGRSLHIPRVS